MIIPKKLSRGDCVALIAPSSSANPEGLAEAIKSVKEFGLEPKVYESCRANHGHVSGPDELRAGDVNKAFLDDEVKGIICLRGGYGTPRILDKIDYEAISKHPKIFLGYSDITGLHTPINKISKLVTFHGPMPAPAWKDKLDPYTKGYLEKILFGCGPLGEVKNPEGEEIHTLVPGTAKGMLVGGNLSLLANALGTPYEIDTKDKILFIEDTGESVYRIDGMFSSMRLAKKFSDAKGIIIGTFERCPREKKNTGYEDLPLMQVIEEIIKPIGVPTIYNFRAGHNYPQPTLPLGINVELDATNGKVVFTEPHCKEDWYEGKNK